MALVSPPHRQCGGIIQRRVQLVIGNRKHRVVFPTTVTFSVAVQCRKLGLTNMPCAPLSSPSRLDVLLLSLVACAFAACSGSTTDNGAPNGSTSTSGGTQGVGGRASHSSTSGGTHLSSTAGGSDSSSGGTATLITRASGGASTTTARGSSSVFASTATTARSSSSGGATAEAGGTTAATARSCVPASQDGPPDHPSSGYESQPCSDCHHDAL